MKWFKNLFQGSSGEVTPINAPPPAPVVKDTVGCIAQAIINDLHKEGWHYDYVRKESIRYLEITLQHPTIQFQVPWNGLYGSYTLIYTFAGEVINCDFNKLENKEIGKACQFAMDKIAAKQKADAKIFKEKKLKDLFPQCFPEKECGHSGTCICEVNKILEGTRGR